MEVRLSSHGAYHHKCHIVWIPKYRKKILEDVIKKHIEYQEKSDKDQIQLTFEFK